MIPVAFLVTIGVFTLARISPVDPVLVFAGEDRDPVPITPNSVRRVAHARASG